MAELNKCPFCGGEILIDEEMSQVDEKTKVYCFCCNDCYSVTYFARCNKEEAIEAWNNRATEEELRANVIDEFAEKCKEKWIDVWDLNLFSAFIEFVDEIASQMRKGEKE